MTQFTTLRQHLLAAPDSHLDASMKAYIEKWDETPTSIQILEVLDYCIHGSLASGFVVGVLQTLYEDALDKEGIKHEDNEPRATWRHGL